MPDLGVSSNKSQVPQIPQRENHNKNSLTTLEI